MSKSQAVALAAALRRIDQPGPALVRIAREPGRGLVVDVILPPYGGAPEGRYQRVAEVEDPKPKLD